MSASRWLIRLLFIGMISFSTQAKIFTTPILAEANELLQTNPEQSLAITSRYLNQRRLSAPKETSRVHINDETDHSVRTPLSTVNALQILAKAHSLLNQPEEAMAAIKQAEVLSTEENLTFSQLESRLIHADIYWENLKNNARSLKMLDEIEKGIAASTNLMLDSQIKRLQYQSLMQRSVIESATDQESKAEKGFLKAKRYLINLDDPGELIHYQLVVGRHYFKHGHYDTALDRLLSGYWLAVENDDQAQTAVANYELAILFEQRKVFDKALEHATQAGEFFEHYDRSRPLAKTLELIASIYEQQGRFNLALVHYFNALDQENQLNSDIRSARLRLNIARVYLQLYNYPKSEQYLHHTRLIATQTGNEAIMAEAQILQGELELAEGNIEEAISNLQTGLIAASRIGNRDLQLEGENILSRAFEQQSDYYNALLSQRRYEQLFSTKQQAQVKSNVEVFKQQQRMLERALHLEELERQQFESSKALYKQKNVTIFLFCLSGVIFIVLMRRHKTAKQLQARLLRLRNDFYTHPRSGLRNLRMLTAKLPNSLQQSSANFEQWHLGEIINEPLSDRLRFALFEVPFLKHIYLKHGYQQGLELERQFGEYLNQQICEPARLYHFSDAMFLYIEPNSRLDSAPDQLANSLQQLVDRFLEGKHIDNRVRIGMAEYPFLPRAYTAINDHELLDILLMATNAAREISKEESGSQWVHLSAIDAAPAASFASDNIRRSCIQGIHNGLVKVQTSGSCDISWNNDHVSDKNVS
ncbi:GGDEF domain-containing protein [Photobacterium rosenbergii]|uniref:tetratricopeptide repeat-containing diguanylate cyclase n=1 Tax=Photobacterium rosenbergii TaxID=294936 RepID=UPI001C9960FC|nr:GGDEF domain-containing protein [Photobacterium rosenbergii]MBY5948815.1 GGDEF domain-containing protein [Photobacterium rosenbergii]